MCQSMCALQLHLHVQRFMVIRLFSRFGIKAQVKPRPSSRSYSTRSILRIQPAQFRRSVDFISTNSVLLVQQQSNHQHHINRMAEAGPDFAANLERFKGLNQSAFVTGYSGGIGKILIQELDKLKIFKRIVLIGRRELELSLGPEFEQRVVDFEKLDDYADVFKDAEVGFHCLGTNMSDVGKEMYVKVDRDYAVKMSELAKSQACKHLLIVTGESASLNSLLFQLRIKAQVEEATKKMDFDRLTIMRPGALMGGKEEKFKEKASKIIFKPITALFPTSMSVPRLSVAKAMIVDVLSPAKEDSKVRVVPNKEIHKFAKEFPQ